MKLVSYLENQQEQLGFYHEGKIFNVVRESENQLPDTLLSLLKIEGALEKAKALNENIISGSFKHQPITLPDEQLLAPVPHPTSCRDAYAFRQHVAAARRNRGVPMIPEFDEYPIFYFTNHNGIQGPGTIEVMPDHLMKLDFELEIAAVIGKKGRNIQAKDADQYIAGFTIMNDMSARTLQMEEMLLNLGPAKGKDFCTVIGPWFVTPDELEPFSTKAKEGHTGKSYKLDMKCWVNGILVSQGNVADMDWSFAEIIERCAYGVDIYPGDVIGSGTVGTGCFLELNGTGLLNDKNYKPQWLKDGDVVEMEITGLGRLKNTIKKINTDFSILSLKKKANISV